MRSATYAATVWWDRLGFGPAGQVLLWPAGVADRFSGGGSWVLGFLDMGVTHSFIACFYGAVVGDRFGTIQRGQGNRAGSPRGRGYACDLPSPPAVRMVRVYVGGRMES